MLALESGYVATERYISTLKQEVYNVLLPHISGIGNGRVATESAVAVLIHFKRSWLTLDLACSELLC